MKYIPKDEREKSEPKTFHIELIDPMRLIPLGLKLMEAVSSIDVEEIKKKMLDVFRGLIADHVKRIDNCIVDGQPIKNGKELCNWQGLPDELAIEIGTAILSSSTQLSEAESAALQTMRSMAYARKDRMKCH